MDTSTPARGFQDGSDDDSVPVPLLRCAPVELDAAAFERFVADTLSHASGLVEDLRITFHERLGAHDGTYDIDATVRFRLDGMDFLVLIEAKRHTSSIKREVVQLLHDKVRSTGAHKGVVWSTAPFQLGALKYAAEHGVGLVHVSDRGEEWLVRSSTRSLSHNTAHDPSAVLWVLQRGVLEATSLTNDPHAVLALLTR
jgi:hypothetical protein